MPYTTRPHHAGFRRRALARQRAVSGTQSRSRGTRHEREIRTATLPRSVAMALAPFALRANSKYRRCEIAILEAPREYRSPNARTRCVIAAASALFLTPEVRCHVSARERGRGKCERCIGRVQTWHDHILVLSSAWISAYVGFSAPCLRLIPASTHGKFSSNRAISRERAAVFSTSPRRRNEDQKGLFSRSGR